MIPCCFERIIMDIKLFRKLAEDGRPSQNIIEWQIFLEWIDAYFKNRKIYEPIIIELGIWFNQQKRYYKQLLDAEHIGIDNDREKVIPDILGNTHDERTVQKLKTKLNGRPINLLFIDAGHAYQDVKRDYEIYGPLTKNIIAVHDVMLERENVRLFWNEISYQQEFITETIYAPAKYHNEKISVGIGLIIKEW